jgi:hypothetical protein
MIDEICYQYSNKGLRDAEADTGIALRTCLSLDASLATIMALTSLQTRTWMSTISMIPSMSK